MKIIICLVAICLFGTLAQANMANIMCNCGLGKGRDACTLPACSPLIIRPQPLPKIQLIAQAKNLIQEIKPIIRPPPLLAPLGDLCSCTNTIVKPAVVPKPKCSGCSAGKVSSLLHTAASAAAHTVSAVMHGAPTVVQPVPYSAPADPVSIQIALALQNQANQACVTESSLAFGFKSMPKDVSKKNPNRITEDDLSHVKGEIVELKAVQGKCGKTLEEEAEDDLRQDEVDLLQDDADIKQLSYGEIGYGPAKLTAPSFVQVTGNGALTSSASSVTGVGFTGRKCHSGFIPGEVIVKQVPMGQALETTNKDQNCKFLLDSEEDEEGAVQFPTFKYSSAVQESSCSSNTKSSSSYFQNFGCLN